VYRKLRQAQDESRRLAIKPVEGKFRTIVLDPPYSYRQSLAGRARPDYAVMSQKQLLALPVAEWAEREAHIYVWTRIVRPAAHQYREDLWAGQRYRPEVWIEKEALLGVVEGVCTEFMVPYFAHRGNNSQTLQYQAGKRFAEYLDQGLIPLVLHLADHDPNGIDMTRDNIQRLALYARHEIGVRRIALNMNQVRQYNPPPSFVKDGDTRTSGYRERFGTDECWELDALSPTLIADLIRTEIEQLIDWPKWRSAQASEERTRALLDTAAANWTIGKR
jgi:hypothetical protein